VIIAFRRPCADHRAALLDFVDRRELTDATPPALAHLERCTACEGELASLSLTIAALRRLHADLTRLEPAPDAWLRLRARVTRPVDPWRWRTTLGGLVTSAFLVAVLVLPVTIGSPATVGGGLELPENLESRRLEANYLAGIRTGTFPPVVRRARSTVSVPHTYPPEIAKVRKEVTSTAPPLRPSEPI